MSKRLWGTVYYLKPAETSPGDGIVQDYFGLYVEGHRGATLGAFALGADAERLRELRERERLNEGKPFVGYIARCQVGHVRLLVATHSEHGVCAYVDQVTSHANNKIEILSADTKIKTVCARNDFFDNLVEDELAEATIEAVCRAYKRVHIQLDRS